MKFKEAIIELYLDWVNNFLTVKRFAEYYNLEEADANSLIDMGRKFHNENVEVIKYAN